MDLMIKQLLNGLRRIGGFIPAVGAAQVLSFCALVFIPAMTGNAAQNVHFLDPFDSLDTAWHLDEEIVGGNTACYGGDPVNPTPGPPARRRSRIPAYIVRLAPRDPRVQRT